MDTIGAQNSGVDASIRDLARSLDCIPDEDLQALANVKASTTEAWRKRGKGPAYIVFGNAILYPREAVAEYLRTLMLERQSSTARSLL